MTNECRSSNDDQGRVIRYLVTSDLPFNGLTRAQAFVSLRGPNRFVAETRAGQKRSANQKLNKSRRGKVERLKFHDYEEVFVRSNDAGVCCVCCSAGARRRCVD